MTGIDTGITAGLIRDLLRDQHPNDEAPLLRHMHEEFLPAHGLRMVGRHHEIHLGDHRRVEPARRRTILRQPVADA